MQIYDQVDYVSGSTRLFAVVGHPIEQVRSPELFTAEFRRRGRDAILVPMDVLPEEFDRVLPPLMRLQNLGGLVFTMPFKGSACSLADELREHARIAGAINALARGLDGRWHGDMFDGHGCVDAFRRRGVSLKGKHLMLLGAGGAGSAMGVAIAFERPGSLRIFDLDPGRARLLAAKVARANPALPVEVGAPTIEGIDVLLNATPVGMLGDFRLPMKLARLPREMVVFDAIVKPGRTPLLALAERCGCTAVYGAGMLRSQVAQIVDFFLLQV